MQPRKPDTRKNLLFWRVMRPVRETAGRLIKLMIL
jgi:hypothetical protein